MHLAWLLFLSSITVQGMPLDSRADDVGEFHFKDEYEACEQASNCHIVIDEDGDRVIDFIPGMGPGSESYEAMRNGTYDDPAIELQSRAYPNGGFLRSNKKYTASGMVGHKIVEFGCTREREIHPAKRLRRALEARCPEREGQCYPGPWTKTIHYMGSSVAVPADYTWQVKAGGSFFPYDGHYYYDVIEAMARHTAQEWGPISWNDYITGNNGQCTRIEGSNYYAVSHWHKKSKLLAGKMHAKVKIPELSAGTGFCSAIAGWTSSMSGALSRYGGGLSAFFGTIGFACGLAGQ